MLWFVTMQGQLPSVTASRSLSKRGCARGSVSLRANLGHRLKQNAASNWGIERTNLGNLMPCSREIPTHVENWKPQICKSNFCTESEVNFPTMVRGWSKVYSQQKTSRWHQPVVQSYIDKHQVGTSQQKLYPSALPKNWIWIHSNYGHLYSFHHVIRGDPSPSGEHVIRCFCWKHGNKKLSHPATSLRLCSRSGRNCRQSAANECNDNKSLMNKICPRETGKSHKEMCFLSLLAKLLILYI